MVLMFIIIWANNFLLAFVHLWAGKGDFTLNFFDLMS